MKNGAATKALRIMLAMMFIVSAERHKNPVISFALITLAFFLLWIVEKERESRSGTKPPEPSPSTAR